MAGALGGDHDHIHIGGRHDELVVNVEAVGKDQGLPRCQIGRNGILVQFGRTLVRYQKHD